VDLGAEVQLDYQVPDNAWIVVAAANANESSVGRDNEEAERKDVGTWTEGPCQPPS
jgi:hypothetical protein